MNRPNQSLPIVAQDTMSHKKLVSISVVAFVAVACALVSTVWFVTKSNGSNYDNEEFFSTFKKRKDIISSDRISSSVLGS